MSIIRAYKITGISPLLQNNPASMERGPDSLGVKKIPTPEDEAAKKVYRNNDGNFYILSEAFRSAVVGKGGAASGRKIGKRTAISAFCAAVFTVEPRCILIDSKTEKPIKKYEIDIRRAVVQTQGILRARPMFPQWATKIALEIDEEFITAKFVLDLLNIAGKVSGVGDFRPQRKGSFGRFKAEEIGAV